MTPTESTIEIKRPLPKVYETAERYPTFVSFFTKKKILCSDDSFLSVEVGMKRFGLLFEWAGEGLKEKNKAIYFIQTKGLLKGLKANWLFQALGERAARVTIKTHFEKKMPLFGFLLFEKMLGIFLVKKTTEKILSDLKKACEDASYDGGVCHRHL